MRLSEKTLELNFCKGLPSVLGLNVFWLGLTQQEEKKFGFDHCTNAGGMLLIIQMKRFHKSLKKTGARRFDAPHHQMQALKNIDLLLQSADVPRFVAYAVPEASDSSHLCNLDCPSTCVNYLDLVHFPAVIPPTGRANNLHYVDVLGASALVHSDEFRVQVTRAPDLMSTLQQSERIGGSPLDRDFPREQLEELLPRLGRTTAFGIAV